MKNKYIFFIIIILVVIIGIVAGLKINQNKSANSEIIESKDDNIQNLEKELSGNEKILIAYFSYTGNTEKLANKINSKVGGDIIKIETVTPYSNNYDEVVDQVQKDQQNNYKPEIKNKIENIEDYDIIILGSPVWWYKIANPVATFISENNLKGKTIIPFVTHGGYGAGQTLNQIKELAPESKVLSELSIEGDSVDNSDGQIENWLQNVGLNK